MKKAHVPPSQKKVCIMVLKQTKSLLMAIETLKEIKSAMTDAGVDILCTQVNHLLGIGIPLEDIADIQREIESLSLSKLEKLLTSLQQSGIAITKMEHYELVFDETQKEVAAKIEEELISQGYLPYAPTKIGDKQMSILRRQVGTDRVA